MKVFIKVEAKGITHMSEMQPRRGHSTFLALPNQISQMRMGRENSDTL
jgi:hypothetical protein